MYSMGHGFHPSTSSNKQDVVWLVVLNTNMQVRGQGMWSQITVRDPRFFPSGRQEEAIG